ncbi:MAG: hypothetical protein LWX83_06770 [Anaerolineae bacterium]|nr:hypothetical protein [Anaerolineae bacterium]
MKKKFLLYFLVILIVGLIALMTLVACSYERGPMKITLTPLTPSATSDAQKGAVVNDQMAYPTTPEALVQAFMLSLQANPDLSSRYLSKTLRLALPVGGPAELLSVSGVIEGVAIQSGAASLEPPEALVDVGLQVNGTINQRRFHLVKEDDRWSIEQIEIMQ